MHALRVFTDQNGKFGDLATAIIDENKNILDSDRQELAQNLDSVETVFVNNIASADISVFHSQGEVDFAGVPVLGAAWLLSKLNGKPVDAMKGRAGEIIVSQNGEITWVRANLETMPAWHHKQLDTAQAVERITLEETKTWEHTMVWAWIDETNGLVRARTFAADWDIPEAQGNGSGSMMLAAIVNKPVEIKHGDGSVIFARPGPNKRADIGGRVIELPSFTKN